VRAGEAEAFIAGNHSAAFATGYPLLLCRGRIGKPAHRASLLRIALRSISSGTNSRIHRQTAQTVGGGSRRGVLKICRWQSGQTNSSQLPDGGSAVGIREYHR
jgi:hypothetical protein